MKWRRAKDKLLRTATDTSEITATQDSKRRTYGYRDWRRRCLFLCSLIQSKKFSQATLDKYSRKNLFKMRNWLTYNNLPPTFTKATSTLRTALNSATLVRIDAPKRAIKKGKRVFKILWKSNLLQKIGIGSILRNDYIKSFLPSDFSTALDDIYICNKLSEPLSRPLFNFKTVAKELCDTKAPTQSCPCRKLFDKRFRPDNKCVYTGDISLVEDPHLRQLLKYGPKFRDFSPANPLVIIKESLNAFIEDVCAFKEGYDRYQFLAWKMEVINETQKRLEALPNITLPEPLLNKSKNALRSLTHTGSSPC
jgi:hypothetical protein